MAVPDGHHSIGAVAALCALAAILGGEYLGLRHQVDTFFNSMVGGMYSSQLNEAKRAVGATTDDELKKIIAENSEGDGAKGGAAAVTAEQVAGFKAKELPRLRDLANGKPTQKEFEAELRRNLSSTMSDWTIMKNSLSSFTFLWVFLGVGTACKAASGEEGDD